MKETTAGPLLLLAAGVSPAGFLFGALVPVLTSPHQGPSVVPDSSPPEASIRGWGDRENWPPDPCSRVWPAHSPGPPGVPAGLCSPTPRGAGLRGRGGREAGEVWTGGLEGRGRVSARAVAARSGRRVPPQRLPKLGTRGDGLSGREGGPGKERRGTARPALPGKGHVARPAPARRGRAGQAEGAGGRTSSRDAPGAPGSLPAPRGGRSSEPGSWRDPVHGCFLIPKPRGHPQYCGE